MKNLFEELLLIRRKEIGEAVTDARNKRGLQQQELAAMCGIDVQILRKIEYGEKNYLYDYLQLVAMALGMHGGELVEKAMTKIWELEGSSARYDVLRRRMQEQMQENLERFRVENVRKHEAERRKRMARRQKAEQCRAFDGSKHNKGSQDAETKAKYQPKGLARGGRCAKI